MFEGGKFLSLLVFSLRGLTNGGSNARPSELANRRVRNLDTSHSLYHYPRLTLDSDFRCPRIDRVSP
jgi:hypothetical protein